MHALGKTIQWLLKSIPRSTHPSLDILGVLYDISTTAHLNWLILAAKTQWFLAFWETRALNTQGEWSRSPKRSAGHAELDSRIQTSKTSKYVCSMIYWSILPIYIGPMKHLNHAVTTKRGLHPATGSHWKTNVSHPSQVCLNHFGW